MYKYRCVSCSSTGSRTSEWEKDESQKREPSELMPELDSNSYSLLRRGSSRGVSLVERAKARENVESKTSFFRKYFAFSLLYCQGLSSEPDVDSLLETRNRDQKKLHVISLCIAKREKEKENDSENDTTTSLPRPLSRLR